MKVSFQRPKRSEYDLGWDCFIAGHIPPAECSRPFADGYNNARRSALKFNEAINREREFKQRAGLIAAYEERSIPHAEVEAKPRPVQNKTIHLDKVTKMNQMLDRFRKSNNPLEELLADRN